MLGGHGQELTRDDWECLATKECSEGGTDRSLTARFDEHRQSNNDLAWCALGEQERPAALSRYLPIPTNQSRTIKLNGRPNNHIITYAIRYLL